MQVIKNKNKILQTGQLIKKNPANKTVSYQRQRHKSKTNLPHFRQKKTKWECPRGQTNSLVLLATLYARASQH